MQLARADTSPALTWKFAGQTLTIDDYLKRQPITALLIAKDGEIVFERYQFGKTAQTHYLSNSMAKSITSIAMGLAQAEGKIPGFDVPVSSYVPELKGTLYGETTLQNLMRMGSGVRMKEDYEAGGDAQRFFEVANASGVVAAAKQLGTVREAPQGSRFYYASPETEILSPVIQAATGQTVASYLEARLWQAIGAEGAANWARDNKGMNITAGCFNALPHDYLRLGIVLANDGKRPDTGKQVIPRQYLLDSTDWHKFDKAFQPKVATPGEGYNNFFWVENSEARRFSLVGVYGQTIYIDPGNKLVMVHLAVAPTMSQKGQQLASERSALWRGVVQHYGKW